MRSIAELLKMQEWEMTDEEYERLERWREERRREDAEYEEECGGGDWGAYDEYESHGRVLYY